MGYNTGKRKMTVKTGADKIKMNNQARMKIGNMPTNEANENMKQ